MKNLFLFCFFSCALFFVGCSKDSVVNPAKSDSESGKVSMKFDKLNTPSGVTVITAALTRSGFTSISKNLNIITDTSAEIQIENVAAGTWHLKIEAKNNDGTVLYSGEADVNVVAAVITQVSIILNPVAGNTGGLSIYVTWRNQSGLWVDYFRNPFLVKTNAVFDKNGVRRPYVIVEGNSCKMWFANTDGGNISSVGYAVSNDGLNWVRGVSYPVLTIDTALGRWDNGSMTVGPVIKVDGKYRMYYSGRSPIYGTIHIGLAYSDDGINWVKHPNPVLYARTGWEENIDAGDVIKINNIYYMYYSGVSGSGYKIGLATSTDGINWTRYSGNPILTATQAWETEGIYIPSVIKVNDKYYMVYQNGGYSSAFGMAVSSDGINWTKDANNPFFTARNTYQNWTYDIMYPCLRMYNNEMRVYYSGPGTGLAIVRKFN